jgi:hypothetical protein
MLVTLGVFLGGLALVWVVSGGANERSSRASDRTFTFPLNQTSRRVAVRSPWKLGHMTPQDDQVELTLVGRCATAHLYAYLSTGWDHGPVNAASVILGTDLHPTSGPPPNVVHHDATSAILLVRATQRGVLVQQAGPRDYNALLVEWQATHNCGSSERGRTARELGRLFESFRVINPDAPAARAAGVSVL